MQHAKWVLAAAALTAAATATAQDQDTSGGLEEITVTAQRREQSLQDVPIAITAFTADQLEQRQVFNTYDLVRNIPNLTGNANVGVGTSSSLYIRGIGNGESIATFDLPVGTYVDDVYVARQNHNNFSLFDVERIEVLRGPQGTLFGRNTTGGAINVVMKKPGEELKGFVEAGIGRFGLWTARTSIDLPISDRLLTKFSAYRIKDDGYALQVSTGDYLNDRDASGLRADIRFLPVDGVTIDFIGEYVDDRNTNFLNVENSDGNRIVNNKITQGSLVGIITGAKANLPLGNEAATRAATLIVTSELNNDVTLTAVTGFRDTDHDFLVDSGGELPRATNSRGFSPLINMGDHEQFSQEIKLNGQSGRLNWTTGLYYMNEDNVTDFANGNSTAATGAFVVAGDRTMKNGLETYAVYGQGDFKLNDAFTVTAGIRYTEETKDFSIERNVGATGPAFSTAAIAAAGIPLELNEQVWTPRVALQYDVSDDVMFFLSATRGFKSGGWPARASANNAFIPFEPETVWSYEFGTRADLFDNRLRLNATTFYSVTNDIQIPARIDINGIQISTTTNPADLENYGIEIDATWVPIDGLNITAGLGMQNAKYVSISQRVLDQAAVCRANPTGTYQGAPACNANFVDQFGQIATPVRSPDYTISMNASYEFMSGAITWIPSFGFNTSDEYAIGTTGSPQSTNGTWSGKQTYINAGVSLRFENVAGLTAAIDCRNCADKAYPMSALGPFQFLDRPGSWGARIKYRF
jgi:iron complex outermembrane receptor protein